METENMQLSGAMPSHMVLRRALLSLMILIPLLWSGIIRLIMSDWELGEILAYFADSWNGGFWSVECDSTSYHIVLGDNGGLLGILFFLQGLVCAGAGAALLCSAVRKKRKNLMFFAVPCFVFGLLLLLAVLGDLTLGGAYGRYCLPQLWGYDIRLLHGTAPVVMYALMAAGYGAYLYLDMRRHKAAEGDRLSA